MSNFLNFKTYQKIVITYLRTIKIKSSLTKTQINNLKIILEALIFQI